MRKKEAIDKMKLIFKREINEPPVMQLSKKPK